MIMLGIETSCDETAVALVTDEKTILSHKILSQLKEHQPYGGVVPEIAARSHMDHLDRLVNESLEEASLNLKDIDAISVTSGPGLIGGVIVGVMMAKGLAYSLNKPLLGINHLEAHALTVRLTEEIVFPYLLLLVSGGHCQILIAKGIGDYELLGSTLDDALGEAFDKVAKMLGLGYPGGPIVEEWAKKGNPQAYDLPKPLCNQPGYDFSLSGLKTAVKRVVDAQETISDEFIADICASFQATVNMILIDRVGHALDYCQEHVQDINGLVVAGGVAANQAIRSHLSQLAADYNTKLYAPPLSLCTDNGAMIAWAGIERYQLGLVDDLTIVPRARWPLSGK